MRKYFSFAEWCASNWLSWRCTMSLWTIKNLHYTQSTTTIEQQSNETKIKI